LVKIGFSDQLKKRVASIISTSPVAVEFVGHMPGGREVEKHLHALFKAARFSGEWFVETEDMRVLFDSLLIKGMPSKQTKRESRRREDLGVIQEIADGMRDASEKLWPNTPVGDRIRNLSSSLGWAHSRVVCIFYADPRTAVRAYELKEFETWVDSCDFERAFVGAGASKPHE